MKIVSWNVNSVRARINNILDYIKQAKPDILLVQEIKTQDENFPYEDFKKIGYESHVYGQKSYNGVAIISKIDVKNIQKIIYLWILKYSNFRKKIWETSTLSSRVISWILNIETIINNGTFDFKKNLFENIISQCNHLKKNIRFEKNPLKRGFLKDF